MLGPEHMEANMLTVERYQAIEKRNDVNKNSFLMLIIEEL